MQWLSKKSWFFVLFFINISERSRKLLFLIYTTKTSHNCHMLKRSFSFKKISRFVRVVRSVWCGECDLYPLSKCGLIRLHYPPPVQPYIACYFHVPEPFLREHLFFCKSRIYVVSRMSAWVTFFSTWSVEWPSKKSGTNWQRTQPTLATRLFFFTLPT